MPRKRKFTNRMKSALGRLYDRQDYAMRRDMKKAAAEAGEKYEKPKPAMILPNRRDLRIRGIGTHSGGNRPFSRLTRDKLLPASMVTHVMLHHTSDKGVVRKMRVPRDQVVRKDQA